MVGYEDESISYCLEVAYNYGVYEYEKGNALQSIGIAVKDVAESLAKAYELGYAVEVCGSPPHNNFDPTYRQCLLEIVNNADDFVGHDY